MYYRYSTDLYFVYTIRLRGTGNGSQLILHEELKKCFISQQIGDDHRTTNDCTMLAIELNHWCWSWLAALSIDRVVRMDSGKK